MIFVPCKDSVSHHPEEYCSPEDWYAEIAVHSEFSMLMCF